MACTVIFPVQLKLKGDYPATGEEMQKLGQQIEEALGIALDEELEGGGMNPEDVIALSPKPS